MSHRYCVFNHNFRQQSVSPWLVNSMINCIVMDGKVIFVNAVIDATFSWW